MSKLGACVASFVAFGIASPALSQEISAGMKIDKAVQILRGIAEDETGQLALTMRPDGTRRKELCWRLKDIDLVVWVYPAKDGTVETLGYWSKHDFDQPKVECYEKEKRAKSIKFDPKQHTYAVEKAREKVAPPVRKDSDMQLPGLGR
jgi:hypothetical protein